MLPNFHEPQYENLGDLVYLEAVCTRFTLMNHQYDSIQCIKEVLRVRSPVQALGIRQAPNDIDLGNEDDGMTLPKNVHFHPVEYPD